MKLQVKGTARNIDRSLVGIITRDSTLVGDNNILIATDQVNESILANFIAILTTWPVSDAIDFPSVYAVSNYDHLDEGDIVGIHSDGVVNSLYRINSPHNFLLFTERCNSNCLMCSQPPRDRDDRYLVSLYKELIPIIPKDCVELGITGGEPTLLGPDFFSLLQMLQKELPETELHCLTNGRAFAWNSIAQSLGELKLQRLMLGIPLYSDVSYIHDYIVQARDAFYQTVQGLHNLARYDIRIEIRIVLHRQTISRLPKLARYIYSNFPFVEHIAFMGLEFQGYTPHNIEKLWVDPVDYAQELSEAMNFLHEVGMKVSLYNSQLCVTPRELWSFSRKSISDWKNLYIPECEGCALRDQCGGFFASSLSCHSREIRPFIEYET